MFCMCNAHLLIYYHGSMLISMSIFSTSVQPQIQTQRFLFKFTDETRNMCFFFFICFNFFIRRKKTNSKMKSNKQNTTLPLYHFQWQVIIRLIISQDFPQFTYRFFFRIYQTQVTRMPIPFCTSIRIIMFRPIYVVCVFSFSLIYSLWLYLTLHREMEIQHIALKLQTYFNRFRSGNMYILPVCTTCAHTFPNNILQYIFFFLFVSVENQ